MNQTEIRKNCADPENHNSLNTRERSMSKPNSRITIIKANAYDNPRDYTPRISSSQKNSDSGKLVRVSSSKGINVTSSRPTSSQKQTRQFNATGNSFHGGSESTIKKEESNLLLQMREQLKRVNQVYENKMNQELSYQYNYMSIQIDRLKQINKASETKLVAQRHQIDDLKARITDVDLKTNEKIQKIQYQLSQFKCYYQKCYQYSLGRVNDIDARIKTLYQLVEQQTSPVQTAIACQKVQEAYDILQRMSNNFVDRTSLLRTEIKQQLFDLQVMIGGCSQRVDEIDQNAHRLRLISLNNEAFCETLKDAIHSNARLSFDKQQENQAPPRVVQSVIKQEIQNRVMRRIKSCQIQIELLTNLQINQQQEVNGRKMVSQQKIQEMGKIIQSLDKKIEEDKLWYLKQIKEKEQYSSRANPRIIELQERLKAAYQLQAHLHKEVSEQNLKIAYLQTKCSKFNEREYNVQSTLAEAYSESIFKQKTKHFDLEKQRLLQKISQLQDKNKQLDRENYLLAQKLTNSHNSKQQIDKLTQQISFLTKLTTKSEQEKDRFLDQINELKKTIVEVQKKNETLKIENKELQHRRHISEEDELYIDELQEEVDKNMKQIEELKNENKILLEKIEEVNEENKSLEENLHLYAETFEKQSVNFRNAIQKLQREKDQQIWEKQYIKKQNDALRTNLEMTKSCQSFYETSHTSLRKTNSTQLSSPKTNKKLQQKFRRKEENIQQLQKAIKQLKLPLPILCDIDGTGSLKQESTGAYITDSNHNLFRLTEQEMKEAIMLGLILL